MKSLLLLKVAMIAIISTVHSQSFEVTSKTNFVINVTVDTNDLYKDFKVLSVFKNTSTNAADVDFVWEATVLTPIPSKWILTLCDPVSCLVLKNTLTSTFRVAINSTKVSIMDLGAISQGQPGSVFVQIIIYPKGKPDLSKTFEYKINVESAMSIELEESMLANVVLYPNPSANTINIPAKALNEIAVQATIFDVVGSNVKNFGTLQNNGGVLSMDISELPAGVYNLMLTTSTGKNFNKMFTKN